MLFLREDKGWGSEGAWEGLEGGKGKEKYRDCVLISKNINILKNKNKRAKQIQLYTT